VLWYQKLDCLACIWAALTVRERVESARLWKSGDAQLAYLVFLRVAVHSMSWLCALRIQERRVCDWLLPSQRTFSSLESSSQCNDKASMYSQNRLDAPKYLHGSTLQDFMSNRPPGGVRSIIELFSHTAWRGMSRMHLSRPPL